MVAERAGWVRVPSAVRAVPGSAAVPLALAGRLGLKPQDSLSRVCYCFFMAWLASTTSRAHRERGCEQPVSTLTWCESPVNSACQYQTPGWGGAPKARLGHNWVHPRAALTTPPLSTTAPTPALGKPKGGMHAAGTHRARAEWLWLHRPGHVISRCRLSRDKPIDSITASFSGAARQVHACMPSKSTPHKNMSTCLCCNMCLLDTNPIACACALT
jgi:hypothetical protein